MLILLSSLSLSWEKGSVGLNILVDSSPRIGMAYPISEKFVLRPYVGFGYTYGKFNTRNDAETVLLVLDINRFFAEQILDIVRELL